MTPGSISRAGPTRPNPGQGPGRPVHRIAHLPVRPAAGLQAGLLHRLPGPARRGGPDRPFDGGAAQDHPGPDRRRQVRLTPPRLFLIDGNSLLYRSFYAIRGLSNSAGFPTRAIYGFVATLRKLMDDEKPELLGVVFDVQGPTIRHEDYEDYKAHRKPMPEDLVVQMPRLKELLRALRIPRPSSPVRGRRRPGQLAARAAATGSGRSSSRPTRTCFQVVDASTSVWNPAKEKRSTRPRSRSSSASRPGPVVDVLALWGDPIGQRSRRPGRRREDGQVLSSREFGSLDSLLAGLDQVKNARVRRPIRENRELLELSRRLVTVCRDLPIELDLGPLWGPGARWPGNAAALRRARVHQARAGVPAAGAAGRPGLQDHLRGKGALGPWPPGSPRPER